MKPTYALNLSPEGIGLWHRSGRGWHFVGEAALDDTELSQRLEFLRRTAAELEPSGITTKLVIPDSQILYRTVEVGGDSEKVRSAAVIKAMEGATPYDLDQLAIDWRPLDDGRVVLAAVARETLNEAEVFAADHRFNAVSFVGQPNAKSDFPGEPFFGEATGASAILPKGERVERDDSPLPRARELAADLELEISAHDEGSGIPAQLPNEDDVQLAPEVDGGVPTAESEATEESDAPLVLTGEPEPGTGTDKPVHPDPIDVAVAAMTAEPEVETSEILRDATWDEPEEAAAPVAASQPPSRNLEFSSDIGMTPRGQILLGLLLIAVAIFLFVSVLMRESVFALLGVSDPEPITVASQVSEGIEDPFAGMVAQDIDPIHVEIATKADRAVPLAAANAAPHVLSVEAFGAQRAVDTHPAIGTLASFELASQIDDFKSEKPQNFSIMAQTAKPDWIETAHAGVDVSPLVTPDELLWLDELKGVTALSGTQDLIAIPLVLAQARTSDPIVAEMPGRRLIARDVLATVPGRINTESSVAGALLLDLARLPGTEVGGPLIRRGGTGALTASAAGDTGLGAKRLLSLPLRHDVILLLPTPEIQTTSVRDTFVFAEINAPNPLLSRSVAEVSRHPVAPTGLPDFNPPGEEAIIALAALEPAAPMPIPVAVPEPEIIEVVETFAPIRPPLAPRVVAANLLQMRIFNTF